MVWLSKALTLKRLKYWLLLVLLGTLANITVVDLPFVVPFSVGNIALFLILLRLGLFWSIPAAGLILLPLYQNLAFAASLLQLAVLLCFNQAIRRHSIAAVLTYAVASTLLFGQLAPAKISAEPLYLLLHSGLSTAVFAFCLRSMLLLDTLTHSNHSEQQPLTLQLSHRVAMYSSIPSTLLIALVLHGAIALDLSRASLRYQAEQHQLAQQISLRLLSYQTQLNLAAEMLELAAPSQVLQMLTVQRPEFISALITDARGEVLHFYKADLPQTARSGTNVSDRPYFFQPKKTGQAFISDTFLGRNLGQDQLFAVSIPLQDPQKGFRGVLEVSIDLKALTATMTTTDVDISHRVLLDRERKKIWGTADTRPLGEVWSVSTQSDPAARKFLRNSWFNSAGPITLTQNAAHLLQLHAVNPGQWQLKYFIDTDAFIQRYHVFLAIAMLIALLLLEAITALSRSFVSRYTVALEQLAENASGWQPDDMPQPRLSFEQSAKEIETLANTLSEMQHRVRGSRRAMQHSMQQIVMLNNELEQRVQLRTEELSKERDRAQQLASVKTRFLANMSHEIRTPITVIKGFTEQLMHKVTAAELPLVHRIQQNTEHLQRLVDDILDTAKIDEGKMNLELQAVALSSFIEDLISSISALVAQKQLRLISRFSLNQEVSITADPFRLKQILLNLLSNAIKFTAKGDITLDVKQNIRGDIEVAVIDQGIGMKPEQLTQLFSAFTQADSSTSRNFGGTGLGLYISRQLAEAMQIQIDVASEPGIGSTFTLIIPASLIQNTAQITQQQPQTHQPIKLVPAKVLIVDDVADIRALIASYLEQQPLSLHFAADGMAAIEICRQHKFDLILMDQQMPELDGFNAARQLRDMGLSCPIILLSADVFEDPGKQLDKVFDLTMTKPFSKQQLLQAIAAQQVKYATDSSQSIALTDVSITSAGTDNDDLLVEYRESLPAYVEKIDKLITQQELDKLQRLLHQIKGTSACFGLTEISESAHRALQALKTGSLDQVAISQLQNHLSDAGT
jgi:signal transduction histidine kinase/DNA-binding response OmpR family regulator